MIKVIVHDIDNNRMKDLYLSADTTPAFALEEAGLDPHSRDNELDGNHLTDDDMGKTFREMCVVDERVPSFIKCSCFLATRHKDQPRE